jgi:hypothetical protein
MDTFKDESARFISDLKISEPTRRIQRKNHYLFGDPEPQSCRRHGIPLNLLPSFANLESLRTFIHEISYQFSGLKK